MAKNDKTRDTLFKNVSLTSKKRVIKTKVEGGKVLLDRTNPLHKTFFQ